MVAILIASGFVVLVLIMVVLLKDIRRLRIDNEKLRDELVRIHAKLDALQSHM